MQARSLTPSLPLQVSFTTLTGYMRWVHLILTRVEYHLFQHHYIFVRIMASIELFLDANFCLWTDSDRMDNWVAKISYVSSTPILGCYHANRLLLKSWSFGALYWYVTYALHSSVLLISCRTEPPMYIGRLSEKTSST